MFTALKECWRVLRGETRTYLTAEEYPALAKLWDNEEDATFDKLSEPSFAEDWDSKADAIYDKGGQE
jgi:hypothetical protein